MDKQISKIVMMGLAGMLCLLWAGALSFIIYYMNQDIQSVKEYEDMGVFVFSPSEVIRTREKQSGRTADTIRWYVEYTSSETEHTYRKGVSSEAKGDAIVSMGRSESRRVIELAEDYVAVPAEQTAQEYIQSRTQRGTVLMYGAAVLVPAALGLAIFLFKKFMTSIRKLDQEYQADTK